jgi:galactose mutarotase-like enzyme
LLALIAPHPAFPSVTEEWRLVGRTLEVKYTFTNQSDSVQAFAFGCHPYLTLGTMVDTWTVQTNMSHYHPLTEELLPGDVPPQPLSQVFSQTQPLGATSLDHTLTDPVDGPPTLSISDASQGVRLTLTCTSADSAKAVPMRFMQVYTPPTRRSLAVEPMSAIGNVFVKFPHLLTRISPGESKTGGFSLALEDLSL